jgi:lysyl-tRNA synthetase class 2
VISRVWDALRTPAWVARIVAVVGAVTLASALLPGLRNRTGLLYSLVPQVFPTAATTGAAAVGVILLLLSRALRRGKSRAWLLATMLSALAAVLHLLKGLDVEEAALSLVLFVVLLSARPAFTARPDPRSAQRVVAVLVVGPIVATVLGWIWLAVDADGQVPGTTTSQRIAQSALGLVGIAGPVRFTTANDATFAAVALVVLGASVLALAVIVAMQPADGPHSLRDDERQRLCELIDRWGWVDSLSYFALRDDRSVIFSGSGKAAVTYRVVGAVSLAAGDPVGDPEAWPGAITAWLQEARSFGWVPAVLGASERAAEAYVRTGMDALELGDEAILHVSEFSLEGRGMRVVRQAVSRCKRAGLSASCHRLADLPAVVIEELTAKVDAWRDGSVERGFSMALGRFGDPADRDTVVVLCRAADGELRGLLNLVPWGADGLSLDLMRRDREAENGVVELMVTELMCEAASLGVRRVSLNFAVFRSVFARGERLGAGPALRLWRGLLLWASRFWQIESLYRANAKYQPEWRPRFVCFGSSADLPRVGLAALRAEAFLVAPGWVRGLVRS